MCTDNTIQCRIHQRSQFIPFQHKTNTLNVRSAQQEDKDKHLPVKLLHIIHIRQYV